MRQAYVTGRINQVTFFVWVKSDCSDLTSLQSARGARRVSNKEKRKKQIPASPTENRSAKQSFFGLLEPSLENRSNNAQHRKLKRIMMRLCEMASLMQDMYTNRATPKCRSGSHFPANCLGLMFRYHLIIQTFQSSQIGRND